MLIGAAVVLAIVLPIAARRSGWSSKESVPEKPLPKVAV